MGRWQVGLPASSRSSRPRWASQWQMARSGPSCPPSRSRRPEGRGGEGQPSPPTRVHLVSRWHLVGAGTGLAPERIDMITTHVNRALAGLAIVATLALGAWGGTAAAHADVVTVDTD